MGGMRNIFREGSTVFADYGEDGGRWKLWAATPKRLNHIFTESGAVDRGTLGGRQLLNAIHRGLSPPQIRAVIRERWFDHYDEVERLSPSCQRLVYKMMEVNGQSVVWVHDRTSKAH